MISSKDSCQIKNWPPFCYSALEAVRGTLGEYLVGSRVKPYWMDITDEYLTTNLIYWRGLMNNSLHEIHPEVASLKRVIDSFLSGSIPRLIILLESTSLKYSAS